MQIVRWLFGLISLYLLASSCWALDSTEPSPTYYTFTDTSGQLILDDVLSNRYANLFVPTDKGPLKLPNHPAALWVEVPLEGKGTQLLELHRSTIAEIDVYLLNNGVLRSSFTNGSANPQTNVPLPHGGFAFPINVNSRVEQKLLIRLYNDYPVRTHISFIPLSEASRIHSNHQALQGILIGLLLGLTLNGLLYGLARKDSSLLLMASSTFLFSLSSLSSTGWSLNHWHVFQGQTSNLLHLAGYFGLAALFLRLHSIPGLSARRHQRIAWLVAGGLVLLFTLVKPSVTQDLLSIVSVGLPISVLIMLVITWMRCKSFDLFFLAGSLLLIASWLPGQLRDLPPHDLKWYLADLMLWAGLVCYSLSLNLSSRRHLLDQLKERHDELAFVSQRAARAEFLTRISHELRTPMNGVMGMSELLLDSALSGKQRSYVQTIHDSGNELLTLINDILDLSRLESEELVMDRLRFDLHALINDCLNSYHNRLSNQPVELISFIYPEVPRLMEGDPARLRQIITSLLNSALFNTDEGEILLVVALDNQQGAQPALRIAVQDTGRGMAREARSSLLETTEPTARLLDIMESHGQLSLYISGKLVKMMGGQIGVRDSQERGTTVWMTLPATFFDSPVDPGLQGQCLLNRSILIVDDSATSRTVLQQHASAWHMSPSTASSGREALAMLRAQSNLETPYEILLVDQSMPGMTGLELISKIKGDPLLSDNLLIIMLSGTTHPPSRLSARNMGIRRILTKPISGYTLRATLIDEWTQFQGGSSQATESKLSSHGPLGDDFNVLVVEDNAVSTRVIEGMLSKLEVGCDTVDNGEKAVAQVKLVDYDLVLMDCEMPEMDGFTATEYIRAWEQQQGLVPLPIIALTAHILPEHRDRARAAGMNGHMAKPVELTQLKALLEHWRDRKLAAMKNS